MAVRWAPEADVSRTAHGYSVLPENVIILPELSGRAEATDIEELSRDIKENGQLEHAVCWKNDEGWPVLAAGHRRYRAIRAINDNIKSDSEKIRLLFNFVDAKTEQEAFDYTIRENRNRVNPSPLDDAHNMHIYQTRFGLNEEQIARKYYPGISVKDEVQKAVREVKNCLSLLELSPEAQDEIRKGFVSTSAALQLAAIPSRAKQNEVIEKAKSDGKKKLKVEDAKAAKEEAIGPPKPRKERSGISENTPVKLLKKFRILAEMAGGLAAENLSEEPSADIIMDLSRQLLVMCKRLNVPLLAKFDKWAEQHKNDEITPEFEGE